MKIKIKKSKAEKKAKAPKAEKKARETKEPKEPKGVPSKTKLWDDIPAATQKLILRVDKIDGQLKELNETRTATLRTISESGVRAFVHPEHGPLMIQIRGETCHWRQHTRYKG